MAVLVVLVVAVVGVVRVVLVALDVLVVVAVPAVVPHLVLTTAGVAVHAGVITTVLITVKAVVNLAANAA